MFIARFLSVECSCQCSMFRVECYLAVQLLFNKLNFNVQFMNNSPKKCAVQIDVWECKDVYCCLFCVQCFVNGVLC